MAELLPLLVSVLQAFSLVKATSKTDVILTRSCTSLIAMVKTYLNSLRTRKEVVLSCYIVSPSAANPDKTSQWGVKF